MGIGVLGHDKDLLGLALSPQNLMLLSQQIVEEVDTRTARTIQKSKCLLMVFIFVVASLLHIAFVSALLPLPLQGYAGLRFDVGFSELTAMVDERVGARLKVKR